jgi:hypothetical protein
MGISWKLEEAFQQLQEGLEKGRVKKMNYMINTRSKIRFRGIENLKIDKLCISRIKLI